MTPLAARILDALPQTQCTRCGFPDCAAYAQAIADGTAAINRCPPGGAQGIARLAAVAGLPVLPLDPHYGVEAGRAVAVIDESTCIGCTLCIKACPVDAILGSNKRMHTVIESQCTGCERCIPVCPVDCIALENVSGAATGWSAWSEALAAQARTRYAAQRQRNGLGQQASEPSSAAQAGGVTVPPAAAALPAAAPGAQPSSARADRAAIIAAAQARARALRKG